MPGIMVVLKMEIYGFNELPIHYVEDNITKAFTSKIKFGPKINKHYNINQKDEGT
jgi:hypothetical protein